MKMREAVEFQRDDAPPKLVKLPDGLLTRRGLESLELGRVYKLVVHHEPSEDNAINYYVVLDISPAAKRRTRRK